MFQKYTYMSTFLLSFLGGVFVCNMLESFALSGIIILFLTIFGVYFFVYFKNIGLFILLFVCGSVVGSGYSIYFQKHYLENMHLVERYAGSYISQSGEILSVHSRSDYYDEYITHITQIGSDIIAEKNVRARIRVPKNFLLEPGEKISFQGKIYLFEDFEGFPYKKFMLSQNLYYSSSLNTFERVGEEISVFTRLFQMRENLLSQIENIFPKREAIFLGGILFGARENIPPELEEDFNNSGLTHFIAVSGFNITLCVIFTTFVFGFLPPWPRILMVVGTIGIFSLFVGLGAPVVRAAIMGIIAYIFLQQGKSAHSIPLVAFTACMMILYSPLALNYDVSMHLSFLAVIGIIYTQNFFKKIFFFVPEFFAIREACVLTLSAMSFVLPVMFFQFGQISLLAPFANIAVTWTIPLAMLGGVITLIVAQISELLGQGFGFLTWILLHFDMRMVTFFGNIQWAVLKVDMSQYKVFGYTLYFSLLIYIIVISRYKKSLGIFAQREQGNGADEVN